MSKKKIKKKIKSVIRLFKEKEVYPIPELIERSKLLNGKVALITGGTGGIGIAIAQSFLASGAKVIICGTSEKSTESARIKILENCESNGNGTFCDCVATMVLNVLSISDINAKIDQALSIFGRIDILVNSAGVLVHQKFLEIDEKEYDRVMDINAKGTFFMTQAIGNYMIEHNIKGHILNITSSSALRPAWTPYQMSKWAVRGFTLGAADKLLPYGIIVNAIAPGPVATEMLGKGEDDSIYMENQPSRRYAVPSEIAEMAVVLTSSLGNLVVGDTVYMTGGSGILTYHH